MIEVTLSKKELNAICKCLYLEQQSLEFIRGFGKPDAEEKFIIKLSDKLSNVCRCLTSVSSSPRK